ncbi:MAG: MBL fold metallo-hydrolase [Myxococcota bacterium]
MHPRDLEHASSTWQGPAGLAIRWLGTAGFELRAAGTTLLIDPYLTRVGLGRFLTRRLVPDEARISAYVPEADAVLVGHSHFDHVMDVPSIARRTGAHVYGSASTANLMQAMGLPTAQVTAFAPARKTTFEVGPFRVTAVPSEHSRFALGKHVPYAGDIPCTCEVKLKGSQYRCGDVFSFLVEHAGYRIYHMGSANLVEDAIPTEAKGADLLLLCIAARFATERFVPRVLGALSPARVMPMHYDNMFRAAEKPMWLLPRTAFGRFVDDVRQVSPSFELMTLPLAQAVASMPSAHTKGP